jgi:hypothetical protein
MTSATASAPWSSWWRTWSTVQSSAIRGAHHQQCRTLSAFGGGSQQFSEVFHLVGAAGEHLMLIGVERAQPGERGTVVRPGRVDPVQRLDHFGTGAIGSAV